MHSRDLASETATEMRKKAVMLFLFAFVLRTLWQIVVLYFNYPNRLYTFDSRGYMELAENLAKTHSFYREFSGIAFTEYFRTPGYPLFLSFFKFLSLDDWVIISAQNILSSLSCVLLFLLCLELGLSKKLALFSGIFLALEFNSILFSNYLLTESIFTFTCLAASLFFLFSFNRKTAIYLMMSGIALGIAILIRPSALPLLCIVIPIIWIQVEGIKKKIGYSFLLLAFAALMVCPWMGRNKMLSGTFFLSTTMSELFYFIPAAHVLATEQHIPVEEARMQLWQRLRNQTGEKNIDIPFERVKVENQLSKEMILKNPTGFAKEYLHGFIYFLIKPARGFIDRQLGMYRDTFFEKEKTLFDLNTEKIQSTSVFTKIMIVVQLIQTILLWLLFLVGMISFFRTKNRTGILLTLPFVICFALMIPGSEAESRFRVPAIPFIAIAASEGLEWIRKRLAVGKLDDQVH